MTLREYLKTAGAPSLTDLSTAMGISKGRLSQLQDATDWPPELALEAERQTGGKLNAAELSPVVARAREAPPSPKVCSNGRSDPTESPANTPAKRAA